MINLIKSILFLIFTSCVSKKDDFSLSSDYVYLGYPTTQELSKEYNMYGNPIISYGLLLKNNNHNKKLIIRSFDPIVTTRYKSKFCIIFKDKLYQANSVFSEIEIMPNSLDLLKNNIGIYWYQLYPDIINPKLISLDSLKTETKIIAENGIILYIPDVEDYRDLDTNLYHFPKSAIIIERLSKKMLVGSYLYRVKK